MTTKHNTLDDVLTALERAEVYLDYLKGYSVDGLLQDDDLEIILERNLEGTLKQLKEVIAEIREGKADE